MASWSFLSNVFWKLLTCVVCKYSIKHNLLVVDDFSLLDDGLDYLVRRVGDAIIEDLIYLRGLYNSTIRNDLNMDIDNPLHPSRISVRIRDTDLDTSLSPEPPLPYDDEDYENDTLTLFEPPVSFQYLDSEEGKC